MKSLGRSIACKENSVCKNISVEKRGFHVALHDYCAMYIARVCVCMHVCVYGVEPTVVMRLAREAEIRLLKTLRDYSKEFELFIPEAKCIDPRSIWW